MFCTRKRNETAQNKRNISARMDRLQIVRGALTMADPYPRIEDQLILTKNSKV